MGIGLGLFDFLGGNLLADHAPRAEGLEITTNEHGPERLSYEVQLGLADAFAFWDPNGMLWARAHLNGLDLFTGRLEDRRIRDGALSLQALGPWRALSDLPYIALWSTTSVAAFVQTTTAMNAVYSETGRWQLDTNNRLQIELVKNTTYTLNKAAGLLMSVPHNSTRSFVGMQFSLEQNLPATMTWSAVTYGGDISTGLTGGATQATALGTAALVNRAYHLTFSAQTVAGMYLLCTTGGVHAGETGASYAKITNLRLVSSTTNRVNTTLTANRAAGAGVTATVGSTAGMYAGMQLVMNSGNNPSEMITITSVTNSTQFVATFVGNYVIGNAVQGFRILADEIAKDIATTINATNSAQLSNSAALIQSPGLDLTDEVYEDATMADTLIDLAAKGDTAGQRWEVGATVVGSAPLLFFRIEGSASQTWYVDALDIDVERSLESLGNSAYITYQDANGRTLRTATSTNTSSVNRYGITRQQAISADTTNATLAGTIRDTSLADTDDPPPRAGVTFTRVFDAYGVQHLLAEIVANDTIVIRNLPPSLATTIDQIRSFRIKHTSYKADDDSIEVEPDVPRPALEFFLSRLAIGIGA